MIDHILLNSLTVKRKIKSKQDGLGKPIETWSEQAVRGFLRPLSAKDTPTEGQTITCVGMLPYGTQINDGDLVVDDSQNTWQVTGEPKRFRSPFTTNGYTEVALIRHKGR